MKKDAMGKDDMGERIIPSSISSEAFKKECCF